MKNSLLILRVTKNKPITITNLLKNSPSLKINATLAEHMVIMISIVMLRINRHKLILYATEALRQLR